jgi:hypothetical protein
MDILADLRSGRVQLVAFNAGAKLFAAPVGATAKNPAFVRSNSPDWNTADRSAQIANAPDLVDLVDKWISEIQALKGQSPNPGRSSFRPQEILQWVRSHAKAMAPEEVAAQEEAIKADMRKALALSPDAPDHDLFRQMEATLQDAGLIEQPVALSADTRVNFAQQDAQMKGIVAAYQARDGSSFDQAWQVAQRRHPYAFQNRAPRRVTTLSAVDVVLRNQAQAEQARQIRAAIARHQVNGTSFEMAFQAAQRENPELFRS